jgi:hypothetical protein
LAYIDKASPRAFKPIESTENAELFGAKPNMAKMFEKIAKGEGMPF